MNLKLTGVGAEPKKIAILAGLLLLAAIFYFSNRSSSSAAYVAPPPQTTSTTNNQRVPTRNVSRQGRAGQQGKSRGEDARPSLKPKKDEQVDRSNIDPTLRTDLLAKLKNVKVETSGRSLFDLGPAAPLVAAVKGPEPPPIVVNRPKIGPEPPPPPPPPTPEPRAPPIPLKFYGWVNQNKAGVRRGFFLDGDEIFVASEGQVVKGRFKIVRISLNAAVLEDTQFKSNNQQTLPLVEEVPG